MHQRLRHILLRSTRVSQKAFLSLSMAFLTLCLSQSSALSQTISAGSGHSLFICPDGRVWATGFNSSGQLGNGTFETAMAPIQIPALPNIIAVAAGDRHSIALKSDGTVLAWGENGNGQLGDSGTSLIRTDPFQVNALDSITAIATRNDHSLALQSDGTVWAWGLNNVGQLGDSSRVNRNYPVRIPSLAAVTAIATGNGHSIALKADSTVWAWGNGSNGQLGNGFAHPFDSVPVQVSGLTGIVKIACGGDHALALQSDGTLWAWGMNVDGQLGNGGSAIALSPVQVSSLPNIVAIAAGWNHSLALLGDGTAWAWGNGSNGELGNGGLIDHNTPVLVDTLSGIVAIAGGELHSMALQIDGTFWAWGENYDGRLGDGSNTPRPSPVSIVGLCPSSSTLRDNAFTNYFRPTSPSANDWVAGELASSILLPNRSILYTFGKSHIGSLTDGYIACDSPEVDNCLVIQNGKSSNSLTTLLGQGPNRSYFSLGNNDGTYLAPGHGYVVGDTTTIFLSRWDTNHTFRGNYLARCGGITIMVLEDIARIDPGDSTIDLGKAVLVDSQYVYAYGTKPMATFKQPYVARRLLADSQAPWEYYPGSGTSWTSIPSNAQFISDYQVDENFSVTAIQGRYYLITHQVVQPGICGPQGNILAYSSDSLWGPFTNPTLIYSVQDLVKGRAIPTYKAYAHSPNLTCNDLLISFNNLPDAEGPSCPSPCDGTGLRHADTWRPKFIKVPYQHLDPQLNTIPLPSAGFTFTTNGNVFTFTNTSTSAMAYHWDFGDGNSSELPNPVHAYLFPGSYLVTLSAIGCDTFDLKAMDVSPGINDPFPSLEIYPNPNDGKFNVIAHDLPQEPISIEIFSPIGQLMFQQTYFPLYGDLDINVQLLGNQNASPVSGLYRLHFNQSSTSATRRILVQH